MDEERLAAALRYVSLNPVRAGLVARAQSYDDSALFDFGADGVEGNFSGLSP
jgi:hypothetical protein